MDDEFATLESDGLLEEERIVGEATGVWGPIAGDVLLKRLRSVEEERVINRPDALSGKEVVGEGDNSLCSGIMGCSIPQSMFKSIEVGEELGKVVGIVGVVDVLLAFSRGMPGEEASVGINGSPFAAEKFCLRVSCC